MYEVATDTDYADRPIVDTPLMQPNTPAPIVLSDNVQSGGYQWITPRKLALGFGGLLILVIGAIAMRSTAISTDAPIKIAPLENVAPTSQQVNKVILEGSKNSLSETKIATDLKIEESTNAMLNERSVAILTEAKRQLADRQSPCFKNEHQENCFISVFITEHQKRYEDAALQRKLKEANHALFEIKAARIALDGAPNVPFTPNITSAAIKNELDLRVSITKQSDNAIAADMYGGKQR